MEICNKCNNNSICKYKDEITNYAEEIDTIKKNIPSIVSINVKCEKFTTNSVLHR